MDTTTINNIPYRRKINSSDQRIAHSLFLYTQDTKKREIALHLCLEKSFIAKEFDLKHYQSIWLTDFSGHVNTSRSISWLWVPWGSGLRWVLSTLACRILRWAGLLDETSNAEATCHSRYDTIKIPPINRWRLYMREIFSRGAYKNIYT